MAENSKIEWTDATWNPITGCSVTSPGCTHCYAMRLAGGRLRNHPSRAGLTQPSKAGPVWTGEVRFNDGWLEQPFRWASPRKIFVCAHGDLFHENVPDEWIDQVFAVIAMNERHTFQVLTKRSARMLAYFSTSPNPNELPTRKDVIEETMRSEYATNDQWSVGHMAWPLKNLWLGVSVEDRARVNRLDDLDRTPAAVRFVSFEPLLEDLGVLDLSGIDLAITGGESGPGYRDMAPEWARSILKQCEEQGVARFHKQMAGKASIPEDMMIRELPA